MASSSIAFTPALGRRRLGLRAPASFPVAAFDGRSVEQCWAVELSSTGLVLERRGAERALRGVVRLRMFLPGVSEPIRAVARAVRSDGPRQALTFIGISDADRLTISEALDRELGYAR
jgi:hypothetical protein